MERLPFSLGNSPTPKSIVAPGVYLDEIKAASQGHLVVVFHGVGSAFAKKNEHSGCIVAKNGLTLLIDLGTTGTQALFRHGIRTFDFDYYYITHSHTDHVNGLADMLLESLFIQKKKPKIVICPPYVETLWHEHIKGPCGGTGPGALTFEDLVDPVLAKPVATEPREKYEITVGTGDQSLHLEFFRTAHTPGDVASWREAVWSTGVVLDGKLLYSGDSRFDADLFRDLSAERFEAIFHDAQLTPPGTVHASYDELKTLPASLKEKTFLYHYGDEYESFTPTTDGFAGFAKPFEIYRWKL